MKKFIALALCFYVVTACIPGAWDVAEQIQKSIVNDDSKTERDSTENIDHNSLHDLDNSESDDEISSESQTLAEKEEDLTEEEVSEDIGILMQVIILFIS